MVKWVVVLGIAVSSVEPVFAEEAPISGRVGLRAGVEGGSTVTLAADPDRHESVLLLGLDGDYFTEQYVLGGSASVGGGPGAYGSVRASMHGGVTAPSRSMRATATAELGMQWISGLCPLFHSDPCGSTALPFTGVRGSFGYAFEHVEVALWTQFLVDLGRDRVFGGNEYKIGGYTLGGGLTVAYVSR